MLKSIIHTLLFAFVLAGCKIRSVDTTFKEQIEFGDSLKKYINVNRDQMPFREKVVLAIGLDSIYNGYKNFQLRIWLGHSMARHKNTVILKYQNNKWAGELLTYSDSGSNSYDALIKIIEYKNVIPKSGWTKFLKAAEMLKIEDFKNKWDSVNCCDSGGLDGILYTFEIATENNYHIYSYSNPDDDTTNAKYTKIVLEFARYLEKEFSFEYTK